MKQFYNVFNNEKVSPLVTQLSWSHYLLLISINDYDEINYYIEQIKKRMLSKRELQIIIKNQEYQRLSIETRKKLKAKKEVEIKDLVPNPILIKNKRPIKRPSKITIV